MTTIAPSPPPLLLPPGFSRAAATLTEKDLRRLDDAITRLHTVNARLWRTEDQVRATNLPAERVADFKREIDQLNAERNALAERADEVLGPLAGNAHADAPLHTETLASVLDRLSVLTLRIQDPQVAIFAEPHSAGRGRGFKSRHPDGIAAGQGPDPSEDQGPESFPGASWEPFGSQPQHPAPQRERSGSAERLRRPPRRRYGRLHGLPTRGGRHMQERSAEQGLGAVTTSGTLIAGEVSLPEVMSRLQQARPVFHSEADLQHSFARVLWELAPKIQSRLEVRQNAPEATGAEYLDLLCIGPSARTAIEFKYFTTQWTGTAGQPPEEYALKSHAATDLARLGFVSDIARLERFGNPNQNGLALLITNGVGLWTPPKQNDTRDRDFRLHEGRTLTGQLLWGGGYPDNTRTLCGSYSLTWQPYALQDGRWGEFRYLAIFTDPQPSQS
ncbi:DUF4254 domain-containing protein [Streptomyces sp. NPDC020917]|uniref:DUF4254 domain-containing protein n=1 Tax=Streptomyces sp. NPDC020917 TaxID=3365102 RepID=UPI0037AFD9EC